ncbi:MAG: TonB-dependent receptor [Pseudomonadota bacterium]|nr:TonB-dependent receptor [Pseudomonadota bacterium]
MLTNRVKLLMAPLMALAWTGAAAQEAADTEPPADARVTELESITVSAQKREEDLDKVPLSVSAISGDELSRRGATDTSALGSLAPNVNVSSETQRDSVFITIRGVSGTDIRNEADPTTAFHVDGAYVTRLSGAGAYFYDLDRVEVLRGPQGTLYGRNSTSGAVNLVSRRPGNELEGYVHGTIGSHDLFRTTGALNLPLIDQKLALRVAFLTEDRDGFRDNGPLVSANGDNADSLAARAHLGFTASDRLDLLLTLETHERKGVGGVQAFLPFPGNPNPQVAITDRERFPLDTQGFRDISDDSVRLEANYDLGRATATYQFSWRDSDRELFEDLDGTAVSDSTLGEQFRSVARTHEFRLTSPGGEKFDWILGAFHLDETIDSVFNIQIPTVIGAFSRLDFDFVDRGQKNQSLALFGQGTWALSDRLNLTGGLRWTRDEKKKPDSAQVIRRHDAAGPPPRQVIMQNQEADWDEVTWRAALDYALSPTHLLYASASTGYKSGGFNRGVSQAIYDPETVLAFEVGSKSTLLDHRLRLNLSAFHYDYEDLQLAQIETGPGGVIENITRNAASSKVWGLEAEGDAIPYYGGLVNFALGYLSARFEDFPNVLDDLTGTIEDLSGNRLVNAPTFTGTLGWEPYSFMFDNGGMLVPRIQFHYETDAFLRVQNNPEDRRDSFTKTDLRLRYTGPEDRWFAEAFVDNIEDESVLSSVSTGTLVIGPRAPSFKGTFMGPRTYGVVLGVRW